MIRPLDHLHSIKLKIGAIIVAAVLVSAGVVVVAAKADLPLWLAGIGAVAVSLLMVQFLARGLTGPLRELADATHDMSAGRYERRVAPRNVSTRRRRTEIDLWYFARRGVRYLEVRARLCTRCLRRHDLRELADVLVVLPHRFVVVGA